MEACLQLRYKTIEKKPKTLTVKASECCPAQAQEEHLSLPLWGQECIVHYFKTEDVGGGWRRLAAYCKIRHTEGCCNIYQVCFETPQGARIWDWGWTIQIETWPSLFHHKHTADTMQRMPPSTSMLGLGSPPGISLLSLLGIRSDARDQPKEVSRAHETDAWGDQGV
eukprot:scaffold20917_cov20-Tisochrysis_lutea.AAC.1